MWCGNGPSAQAHVALPLSVGRARRKSSFAWLPPLLLDAAHLGGELGLSKASYRPAAVGRVFIHRMLREVGTWRK